MLTALTAALSYSYSYGPTTNTMSGSSNASMGTLFAIWGVIFVISIFLFIIPMWKIFKKCGQPGWASIIPLYNTWVLFEIVGYPGWWAILSIIPLVNIFPLIMMLISYFKLAKLFGKGDGFAICTVLFSFVCIPILGYGKAQPTGLGTTNDPNGNSGGFTPPQPPVAPNSPAPNVVMPPTPPQPPLPPQQPPVAPTPPQPPVAPQPPVDPTPPVAPPNPPEGSNPPQGF